MNDLFRLESQVAIVTGGSRGLGKVMGIALAEAGADIVICSRNKEQIEEAAREISALTQRKVLPCVTDVTNRGSVERMVEIAIEEFGRIDILVNNAGVNIRNGICDIKDEDWDFIQQVNVTGVFYCCRAVCNYMIGAGYGRIINVGSALSLVGLEERVSYTASKGAVLQLTRTLALELAEKGVTVNCLCPGPFGTEINRPVMENADATAKLLGSVPMNRWGRMDEIKSSVLFLASKSSSYVTGAALAVDGGWTAK